MDESWRPSRLLNLNKASAGKKALSALNSSSSPLLKLPTEVRARIWEYTLGGHILHSGRYRYDVETGYIYDNETVVCCKHPEQYDNISTMCHSQPIGWGSDLHMHDRCFDKTPIRQQIGLDLLLTCRQIHHEAALLPFAKNCFIAGHMPELYHYPMKSFMRQHLNLTQIRAIQHLIIEQRSTTDSTLSAFLTWAHLCSSKTLKIIVEQYLGPECVANLDSAINIPKLKFLGKLNLSTVHVGVRYYIALPGRVFSLPDKIKHDTRSWQDATEKALLNFPEHESFSRATEKKAKEQARKEERALVRRTRNLRDLEKAM